jgi:hypothetical protein
MPNDDCFERNVPGLDSPGERHTTVTPSDDDDLSPRPRALYVGTGGDLATRDKDGTVCVWKNVPSGALIPFRAMRVMGSGTLASDILAID